MELFDEDVLKTKNKNEKKGINILLIFIILLTVLCIVIISLIIYLKDSIYKISIDGVNNNELGNIFIFNEEEKDINVPIRKIAEIFGYESYNGEYLNKSEDTTKCYVKSENEVVNITLNSNQITKKDLTNDSTYEEVQLDKVISENNGELYANIDGIEKIFNVKFEYDVTNKRVEIYTLSYLVNYYSEQLPQLGYVELKQGFSNQKIVLNDIIIAKNEKQQYGAIKISTGEIILEPKYDNIEYIKDSNEFLVTANGRKGIFSIDKEEIVKIDLGYEDIKEINNNFYVVTKNDNVGIISKKGESIIYPKYDNMGIEKKSFKELKGAYILLNDLIPVKEESKWAIFKLDGTQVTDFIYDDFGCVIDNDKDKESVIYINGYNVFVAKIDKKYYLVTEERKKCNRIWF